MSANLLSMGAVDFGVIVDGGVVIIESILFRLAHPHEHQGARGADQRHRAHARGRPMQVVRPTVFALLIIIAAYLPIFMLERVEGRIFSPMANTVVAALVGALIFSVTLVPVLAALAYRKPVRAQGLAGAAGSPRALYEPTLRWALERPVAGAARWRRWACWRRWLVAAAGWAASSSPSSTRAASTSPSPCPRTSRSPRGAS